MLEGLLNSLIKWISVWQSQLEEKKPYLHVCLTSAFRYGPNNAIYTDRNLYLGLCYTYSNAFHYIYLFKFFSLREN